MQYVCQHGHGTGAGSQAVRPGSQAVRCLLVCLPWAHPYHLSQITAILSSLVVVEALSDAQLLGLRNFLD